MTAITRAARGTALMTGLVVAGITCGRDSTAPRQQVPTSIAFVVQPGNATAGASIGSPLQVAVRDASGNKVAGATLTVSLSIAAGSGSTGASLAGTVSQPAVNGIATFNSVSIAKAGSGYRLTASAASLPAATSATFDIVPAAASTLSLAGQPADAVAGSVMSPSLDVIVQDAFGNTVTAAGSTIRVSISAGTGSAAATLSGTVEKTAVSGIANFDDLHIDKAGAGYTLAAATAGLTSAVTSVFTVSAAAASRVAILTQPASAMSGQAISPAVVAQLEDDFGNVATMSTASVSLAITGGTGAAGALLSGTTTRTTVSGVATFGDISIDRAAPGYTLTAAATNLSSSTSSAFDIAPGTPASLGFVTQPAGAVAGADIAPEVAVEVRDAAGNAVISSTASITVEITAATGATGAMLSGMTTQAAVSGVATFAGLTIDRSGSGYTLTATSPSLVEATTQAFAVDPGPPARLAFTVEPGSSTGGAVIAPAMEVAVEDAFGNLTDAVTSITVGIAAGSGAPQAVITGTTTRSSSSGVAIFNDLAIDRAASAYTLSATATDLTAATSALFDVTVGSPVKLGFEVQPSTTPQGTAVAPGVQVQIQDAGGNVVTSAAGDIAIAITNGSGTSGATLSGTSTNPAVSGTATFDDLAIDLPGTSYTFTASSGALASAVSSPFGVNGGTIGGTISLAAEFLVAQSDALRVWNKTPATDGPTGGWVGWGGVTATPVVSATSQSLSEIMSRVVEPALRVQRPTRFIPGEVIVTYRATALTRNFPAVRAMNAQTLREASGSLRLQSQRAVAAHSGNVMGVSPAIRAARIRVPEGRVAELLAALAADPTVESAERHSIVEALEPRRARPPLLFPRNVPNDPLYPAQAWHYEAIGLGEAWSITTGSGTVVVAVVDDGIRFDHPAIAANLTNDGYDFVSSVIAPLCGGGSVDLAGDGDGYDPDPTMPIALDRNVAGSCYMVDNGLGGHGLHVAGTIGAAGNDGLGVTGVNWNVRIRPVRVLNSSGSGGSFDVANGILYAAGMPVEVSAGVFAQAPSVARIINLSLGTSSDVTVMRNAVASASAVGALIIGAAGNDNVGTPFYPAAYPEVLSVSAIGPDFTRASYSNFGPTIDIAAPGGDMGAGDATYGIASTRWNFGTNSPAYAWIQGTSMAAPHVSGVAALLLAQNPTLSATELRARLVNFAVDLGAAGRDDFFGAGLVNARNSLTQTFGPSTRSTSARLYSAASGSLVAHTAMAGNGTYSFEQLVAGSYWLFAGQDEDGDGLFGLPGRRWGAAGVSAVPTELTVAGASTQNVSVDLGFAIEREPNDAFEFADVIVLGGHLFGFASNSDVDYSRVAIPTAGPYTFETLPYRGACGYGADLNTVLQLYSSSAVLLASNDDVNAAALNYCSRITVNLSPGTYYLATSGHGSIARRYYVVARAGS